MQDDIKTPSQPETVEQPHQLAAPAVENVTPPAPIDPAPLNPSDLPSSDDGKGPVTGDGSAKKHSDWRDFWTFIGILLIALVLAFGLVGYVFRSYSVDGPSMETTLHNEDKLIIWKVPRTIARITGHQYVPDRGDVIIFHKDDLAACGQMGGRDIIKRVIGLPGERVVVQNGVITIFNKEHPQGFEPDATLPYNKDHIIPYTTGDIDITLPDNQIFVSGDNRPNSCDSRAFGPVDTKDIIGKLVVRLLPANKIKLF